MEDRFGPLPKVVKELFHSFELRWLAQEMGTERLVMKSGSMVAYFISNPQSAYYDSELFQQMLRYIQKQPKDCKLSEKNDKLRLLYSNVKTDRDTHSELSFQPIRTEFLFTTRQLQESFLKPMAV